GYGIHLVLGVSRWMDVRSALREAIGGRLEMRLNDPTESAIDRRAAGNIAVTAPGRGLTPDRLLFHTALPRVDGKPQVLDLAAALGGLGGAVARGWGGRGGPPVRVLPRRLCLEDLAGGDDPEAAGVPIAISGRGMGVVRIDLSRSDPHFLVLGDGESGKTTLL